MNYEIVAIPTSVLRSLLEQIDERSTYRLPDHACQECVPGGELRMTDYRCYYHTAKAILMGKA